VAFEEFAINMDVCCASCKGGKSQLRLIIMPHLLVK